MSKIDEQIADNVQRGKQVIESMKKPQPACAAGETPRTDLLKAWKIEPPGVVGIDALYILHHENFRWGDVMNQAEYALEQQMEDGDRERAWDEMKVTITGVLLTPEEWEEINNNEY